MRSERQWLLGRNLLTSLSIALGYPLTTTSSPWRLTLVFFSIRGIQQPLCHGTGRPFAFVSLHSGEHRSCL